MISSAKVNFSVDKSIEILERTPVVLSVLLSGLSNDWINCNEGEGTWSAFDVVGHLIHGEKTDWMVRAQVILSTSPDKTFQPFDRFAQFENSKGKSLDELLSEFKVLRAKNLSLLKSFMVEEDTLLKKGKHPALGEVSIQQLLATWVVHDLDHLAQISRVMAKQYTHEVGPWIEYLKIIRQ